jgi:hypothetical protein
MKKVGLLILYIAILQQVSAQDATTEQPASTPQGTAREIPWYKGSIILSDGTDLTGLVRFNDWNGVVAHQDSDGEARAFNARNVSAFGFYDEEEDHYRSFYTFEIENYDDNLKRPYFFEVLRDYGHFAILVKRDPADLEERRRMYPIVSPVVAGVSVVAVVASDMPALFTKVVAERIETVYFMDAETGEIKPYIQCKTRQNGTASLNDPDDARERNKMLDEGLPEKFVTTRFYRAMVQHAINNKLQFRRKDDFLKIMDYYSQLSGNKPR